MVVKTKTEKRSKKPARRGAGGNTRKMVVTTTTRTIPKKKRSKKIKGRKGAFPDPFDVSQFRLPSPYVRSTVVEKCRGTLTVTQAATAGSQAYLFKCNPLISLIDLTKFMGYTVSPATTGQTAYTGNPSFFAAVAQTNLQAALETFRVTSAGIKIRITTPPLYRTGRIVVCKVPDIDTFVGYNALVTQTLTTSSSGAASLTAGINPVYLASSSVYDMPGAEIFEANDMNNEVITIPFKPTSDGCTRFRDTNIGPDLNGITSEGAPYGSSAGIIAFDSNIPLLGCEGWEAIAVFLDGFPVSQPSVQIEYIYHIEGTPKFSQSGLGTSGILVPETGQTGKGGVRSWQAYLNDALVTADYLLEAFSHSIRESRGVPRIGW